MHLLTRGHILLGPEALLRGQFDLMSGPRGWRATVLQVDQTSSRTQLIVGTEYRLRLPDGATCAVELDAVSDGPMGLRFRGIGDPPTRLRWEGRL